MIRLIINADDFGLSHSVNEAILESFHKGFITNTTLMVNMPGVDEAVEKAKMEGFWNRVGLHINLFEGTPINRNLDRFAEIHDQMGRAKYWAHGVKRFYLRPSLRKEIKKEVELQIEKFMDYQPQCKHVDSHGHFHTNYSVWHLCKELFQKYGFESTRLSRNLVAGEPKLKGLYKGFYNKDVKKSLSFSTDFFGNFRDYKAFYENGMLDKLSGKNSCIELMCHPVYEDGILMNAGSIFFSDVLNMYNDVELIKF